METENFVVLQEYLCKQKFLLKNREHVAHVTLFDTWLRSLFTFGL